jgi:hypothetical protein
MTLTVNKLIGMDKRSNKVVEAVCSYCGGTWIGLDYNIKSGNTISCGCRSSRKGTHGQSWLDITASCDGCLRRGSAGEQHFVTGAYSTWAAMKQRCYNPKNSSYERYGARGIKVCPEWMTFEGFYKDMGDRPEGHEIDRIDPDGNYCKDNCRWLPKSENRSRARRGKRK